MSDSARSETGTDVWSFRDRSDQGASHRADTGPITGWEAHHPLGQDGTGPAEELSSSADLVDLRDDAVLPRDLDSSDDAPTAPLIASDLAEHDLARDPLGTLPTPDPTPGPFPTPDPTTPTPEPVPAPAPVPEPSPVPQPAPEPVPSPEPPTPAPVPDPEPVPDPSPAPPPADPTDVRTDQWRDLACEFVDDPRAAVEGATALVQRAVEEQVGLSVAGTSADTEQLRVAFTRLRDLHARLTR